MREEFHGGDVGIRIGDAPRHQATCIGLALCGFGQFGNQQFHGQPKQSYPHNKRYKQPTIQ